MKLIPMLMFASSLAVCAETEEQINKRFAVQPGGKVVVDVDFGSIDVSTNATSEVVVDVYRKVNRRNKSSEEEFLRERPVTFSQDGNTVTIRSRAKSKMGWSWHGWQRTEGKYTITVPAQFNAQLKTSGGGIGVSDLSGETKADTSGGGLKFARLRGPLDGGTSGGRAFRVRPRCREVRRGREQRFAGDGRRQDRPRSSQRPGERRRQAGCAAHQRREHSCQETFSGRIGTLKRE